MATQNLFSEKLYGSPQTVLQLLHVSAQHLNAEEAQEKIWELLPRLTNNDLEELAQKIADSSRAKNQDEGVNLETPFEIILANLKYDREIILNLNAKRA